MPNIGSILREEIQRLARRVSRQADARIKKDVVFLKHQVAGLKRAAEQARRDNLKLMADLRERLTAPPSAPKEELKIARLSPRLIRAQRARLGLSREAFAKLLGVSAGAVLAWEADRSKPRAQARAALVAVRKLGKREARWRLEALSSNGRPSAAQSAGSTKKRSAKR